MEESINTLLTLKAGGVVCASETLPCQAVAVAHDTYVQVPVTVTTLAGLLNTTLSQRITIETVAALLAPKACNSTQENEHSVIFYFIILLQRDSMGKTYMAL